MFSHVDICKCQEQHQLMVTKPASISPASQHLHFLQQTKNIIKHIKLRVEHHQAYTRLCSLSTCEHTDKQLQSNKFLTIISSTHCHLLVKQIVSLKTTIFICICKCLLWLQSEVSDCEFLLLKLSLLCIEDDMIYCDVNDVPGLGNHLQTLITHSPLTLVTVSTNDHT